MRAESQEFNLFVYLFSLNLFLDLVIWCLGPYVDDTREYRLPRLYLAVATRGLCRRWLRHRGVIADSG